MGKGKSLVRWATIPLLALVIMGSAYGVSDLNNSNEPRADVISIDTLKVFGDLERPEVVFLHDKHTDALEKKNKDCSTCHLSGKDFEVIPGTIKEAVQRIDHLSPKFKRLKDTGRKEVMDIYHANCIDCHKQMTADGDESGPVLCAGCHAKNDATVSSRKPFGFDKSLHFRHLKAQEKKCEACHHEYDEKQKKLFYAKEKEGTCRYCHKKETEENRISIKMASHLACIKCHRDTAKQNKPAGPSKCFGCHDSKSQENIEKVASVPRMERKQPDLTLVQTGLQDTEEDRKVTRMSAVPFNHKNHETRNETCQSCHHASLEKCSKCHTIRGAEEGDGIKLELAMHLPSKNKSCIGCHTQKQDDKKCAGCHVFMEKGRMPETSCSKCHMDQPNITPADKKLDPPTVAKTLLESRTMITDTYSEEEIPEKVIIKDMVNKYGAVELPHRKIVLTLAKNIADDQLAGWFHKDKGTVCQGCHHNSPAAKKPPRCGNCHGKPFNANNLHTPGLTGAYHRQCMGCHKVMGIKKPAGCTDCHKEKEPS